MHRSCRDVLGHAWSYYAGNFANTATKDYVLAVAQSSLLNLRWSDFVPDASDVDQMVRIIDTFLPLCHGFLGKVFVQIQWLEIVEEQRQSESLVQAVLRLVVKLAAEPQVRQVRRTRTSVHQSFVIKQASLSISNRTTFFQLGVLHQLVIEISEAMPWWRIEAGKYETLMQVRYLDYGIGSWLRIHNYSGT